MIKVIINAFGPDKPGIVYKISAIILSYKGNIENSKMIRLESDFTCIMLISIPENKIIPLKKELSKIKPININLKITDKFSLKEKYNRYNFSITVSDDEGIIFLFSKIFSDNKINIEKMETDIRNAPITGSPIFILDSILIIPKDLNLDKFKKTLNKISKKNNIDYKLFKSK